MQNLSHIEKVVNSIIKDFNRIDILVNNAGITRDTLLMRMKEEDWDSVININLKGSFLCCKEAVKIMKKYGYEGALTVEPGADASTDLGDFWGLMKTWKLFGSPVYGAHGPARADVPKATWSDIQYSYFGQTKAPYYIFGPYAPSQDWTLWSQTPFE